MLAVAALLAALVGSTLGFLGGGGAILTTPVFVYVLGLRAEEAVASSLLVVGATSVVGAALHARRGNVDLRTGAVFGLAGMAGAFAGGRLAAYVPGTILLVSFAVVTLATATAMLRRRPASSEGAAADADATCAEQRGGLQPAKAVAAGAAVGLVAGFVGAGGGFLVVPALSVFGRVPMLRAVGTSLFVIALQSFAGFAGHAAHAHVAWPLVALFAACAAVGTLAGVAAAQRVSPSVMRRGFAWFVLAVGLFVFAKEITAS